MNDNDLHIGTTYWAEIKDETLKEYLGKQLKVKFTGIYFREVDDSKAVAMKNNFLLAQLKIFREVGRGE